MMMDCYCLGHGVLHQMGKMNRLSVCGLTVTSIVSYNICLWRLVLEVVARVPRGPEKHKKATPTAEVLCVIQGYPKAYGYGGALCVHGTVARVVQWLGLSYVLLFLPLRVRRWLRRASCPALATKQRWSSEGQSREVGKLGN